MRSFFPRNLKQVEGMSHWAACLFELRMAKTQEMQDPARLSVLEAFIWLEYKVPSVGTWTVVTRTRSSQKQAWNPLQGTPPCRTLRFDACFGRVWLKRSCQIQIHAIPPECELLGPFALVGSSGLTCSESNGSDCFESAFDRPAL